MQVRPVDLGAALSSCAQGNRTALRYIFDEEAPRLVAVATRILRRRELAEEAVQDAFIRIWTHAHQYSPERGSARGWINAVVRNRALNMLRDGRRETPVADFEAVMDASSEGEIMAAWRQLDQDGRLHACLAALDDVRRRGILMAYVGGYTHGEIAGRLRVPLGTAKSWIRRGLTTLRECMT